MSEYSRIFNELMTFIESLEDSDSQESRVEEDTIPESPSLKLNIVILELRARSRIIDVVAYLSSMEDENDIHEVKILSFSPKSPRIKQSLKNILIMKSEKSWKIEY